MDHMGTSWAQGRHWGLLVVLAISLSAGGCKKFSQDVETLASSSLGSSDEESYTDEFGAAYYLGTPSNESDAIANLFLGAKSTYAYGTYDSLIDAHAALNSGHNLPIASRDTNARSQWALGWTGRNVKVGVLDEFDANEIIDTHGDKVSLIVNSVAPEAQLTNYNFTLTQDAAEAAFQNLKDRKSVV